jgi:competence protein ComEC
VLIVEYGGHTALFAGDIPGSVETRIFAAVGAVDIYKAAHHGSDGSSYRLPLSVLEPDYSVVSVGTNRYGHPGALALDALKDYSGEVFLTTEDFAVEFYIGGGIRIHTYGGQG